VTGAKIGDGLCNAARRLRRQVDSLRFGPPVSVVYDPLAYARGPHEAWLRRYGDSRKRVVFVGMNPGPFGMAQTGVPFGDVRWVRDWLGIEGKVDRPAREHPKRPIQGFDCPRSEVSGTRLWGAIAERFGTPKRFFAAHFITNYCPLVFVEASSRNRTPDKLPAAEREPLFEACDRHLRRVIRLLEPEWVVGVGAFAESRARAALGGRVKIGRVLHPSPANPRAQSEWGEKARTQLASQGVCPDGAQAKGRKC
jgi:single-strand selective monofunctional uracil DNA glycosylase